MRLQESLEKNQPAPCVVSAVRVRSVGVAAAGALLAGAGHGDFHGGLRRRVGRDVPDHASQRYRAALQDNFTAAEIGGITSIQKDPTNNTVKVQYDRVMPGSVEGSLNDPKVKDLLLYAAKSDVNAGTRLNWWMRW